MKNGLFGKHPLKSEGCDETVTPLVISYLVIDEAFTDNGGLDVRFVKLPMKLQKHQAYVGAIWRHWIFWTWWQRKRPRLFQFTYRSRWLTKNRSIADEFLKANIQTPWRGNGMYFYGKVLFTCCVLRLSMECRINRACTVKKGQFRLRLTVHCCGAPWIIASHKVVSKKHRLVQTDLTHR